MIVRHRTLCTFNCTVNTRTNVLTNLQLLQRGHVVSERSMEWNHQAGLNCSDDIKQFIGTGCVSLRILAMAEYLFQKARWKCSGMQSHTAVAANMQRAS